MADNQPAMKFLNPEGVPDELLPLWLADQCVVYLFRQLWRYLSDSRFLSYVGLPAVCVRRTMMVLSSTWKRR